ncbi:MAG: cell division protein [Proteobacteria bacterium]|nr:cell division protein [Pseudomonadota bacterium]
MILSGVSSVFTQRVRGFRVIDLLALFVLLALALGVYAFKTLAGRESADIADVQSQIVMEQKRVRLLRAEIAHLEDPSRIERLSSQYLGFKPVDPKREASIEALPQVASQVEKPAAPAVPPAEVKP